MPSPVIRVRLPGTIYIILTIVLGVVAVNSSNNLLYLVTALMLGYMAASGFAGKANITGVGAEIRLPDEIYAGVPFRAEVTLRNTRRRASVHMTEASLFCGGVRLGSAFFGIIPPRGSASKNVIITLPARGEVSVSALISSVYPFDLFTRYSLEDVGCDAVVFPAPLSDGAEMLSGSDDDERDGSRDGYVAEDASSTAGIRPYQDGDPMNRIHWKITARTGKLSSRLLDDPPQDSLMIDLEESCAGGFERGLSLAAGSIIRAGRANAAVGLRDGGTVIPPASSRAARLGLLRYLAMKK